MGQRNKRNSTHERAPDQEMRDQEVMRARRELAAYFKGRRTEREARAALKVIKAFIRDRERLDPKSRPALPGIRPPEAPKGPKKPASLEASNESRRRHRPKSRRKSHDRSRGVVVPIEPQIDSEPA